MTLDEDLTSGPKIETGHIEQQPALRAHVEVPSWMERGVRMRRAADEEEGGGGRPLH